MQLQRFDTPETFYQHVEPFLLAREAQHNLLFGIIGQIIDHPEWFTEGHYLAAVNRDDTVVAAALRTPPRPLHLAHIDAPDAIPLLAHDLHAVYGDTLSGVSGPSGATTTFVELYQRLSGQSNVLKLQRRVFELHTVNPVTSVRGKLRKIIDADRPLLQAWIQAFFQEALHEKRDPEVVDRAINYYLELTDEQGIYFWEDDGEAVSMATATGPTPNGMRVINVYTPPEKRRQGYASACVAGLSQLLLDSGRKYCFLATDITNPTSNRIYQDVGYQPVCDLDEYTLLPNNQGE